jgi:hypothetical protein|tara:strand:- start:2478 stop:2582 length:105 start_codon:yes stop_codon:yes gene_type:complete
MENVDYEIVMILFTGLCIWGGVLIYSKNDKNEKL